VSAGKRARLKIPQADKLKEQTDKLKEQTDKL